MTDDELQQLSKAIDADGRPLNDVLDQLGYHTKPAGNGRKHVFKREDVMMTGRAHEVWAWLHETKQI